jgi:hypothetical protein
LKAGCFFDERQHRRLLVGGAEESAGAWVNPSRAGRDERAALRLPHGGYLTVRRLLLRDRRPEIG